MDSDTFKIAFASLLGNVGLMIDKNYFDLNNEENYDFFKKASLFSELMHEFIPDDLKKKDGRIQYSLKELLSGVNKPANELQQLLNYSWKTAIGLLGNESEPLDSSERLNGKEFLYPLFEKISIDGDESKDHNEDFRYHYPLEPVSSETIFPKISDNGIVDKKESLSFVFEAFKNRIKTLDYQKNSSVWFEHFDSIMMQYTSNIPSFLPGEKNSDISIYDHSKVASAIAAALYLFHSSENESLTSETIADTKAEKFLIVSGNFFGIQNFIFKGYGETGKFRSKIMRGRSFFVSLLSELSASMLCEDIGLPPTSVIVNAAGKFIMLIPNTKVARDKLSDIEKEINEWLVKIAYGETVFGISSIKTSCVDLNSVNFANVLDKMDSAAERKKHIPLDIANYNRINDDYLDRFINTFTPPVCWICQKRPSEVWVNEIIPEENDKAICNICRDQIFIGTHIVKKTEPIKTNKLLEKIFGRYQLEFKNGTLLIKTPDEKLLKSWQLNAGENNNLSSVIKYISGYVPVHSIEENEKEFLKKIVGKEDLIAEISEGVPKTLNYIACMAKQINQGKISGLEALGVLKADVDNLGLIMACGIAPGKNNLARMAAFSRQIDQFFTVFLPEFLKKKYKNVYTVFAGGDDLFLIGPWNDIIGLSIELRNRFDEYVCNNSNLHFSSGITIHKPGASVESIASAAEKALEKSKTKSPDKDSFTLFSKTERWEQFELLSIVKTELMALVEKELINKAMLYRLNSLIELVEEEKRIIKKTESTIHLSDLNCTKWRYLLAYTVERNIKPDSEKEITKEKLKEKLTLWLDKYEGSMIIPLWQILYNLR